MKNRTILAGALALALTVPIGWPAIAGIVQKYYGELVVKKLTVPAGGTLSLPTDSVTSAMVKDADLVAGDLAANTVTPAKISAAGKRRAYNIAVEDLAADADIAIRAEARIPDACTVTSIHVLSKGTAAGIDATNTSVWAIVNTTGPVTLSTKTYNNTVTFPAANAADAHTLSATAIAAGDIIAITVTNGTAANPPAAVVVVACTQD